MRGNLYGALWSTQISFGLCWTVHDGFAEVVVHSHCSCRIVPGCDASAACALARKPGGLCQGVLMESTTAVAAASAATATASSRRVLVLRRRLPATAVASRA
jgi:hypothetical protein